VFPDQKVDFYLTRRMLRYAPRFHKKVKKISQKNIQKKISKKILRKFSVNLKKKKFGCPI
jgi:hypothetical protein